MLATPWVRQFLLQGFFGEQKNILADKLSADAVGHTADRKNEAII